MELDGVAGEVLYPSQGLSYFNVADTLLMSAIFRAYNEARLSGAHIMAPRNHSAIAEVIAEARSAGTSSIRTQPSGGAEACA
jgi:hypothetical protein